MKISSEIFFHENLCFFAEIISKFLSNISVLQALLYFIPLLNHSQKNNITNLQIFYIYFGTKTLYLLKGLFCVSTYLLRFLTIFFSAASK